MKQKRGSLDKTGGKDALERGNIYGLVTRGIGRLLGRIHHGAEKGGISPHSYDAGVIDGIAGSLAVFAVGSVTFGHPEKIYLTDQQLAEMRERIQARLVDTLNKRIAVERRRITAINRAGRLEPRHGTRKDHQTW